MAEHDTEKASILTLKRKHSDGSESQMEAGNFEDIHTITAALVIDPDGDLDMVLDGGALKISRKALSLSSPVFLAMLGNWSQFREPTGKTLDVGETQSVSFENDDFQSMAIIARIVHLQTDKVPHK